MSVTIPEEKKVRVIVNTDAKNEMDDQFAIRCFQHTSAAFPCMQNRFFRICAAQAGRIPAHQDARLLK